MWTVYRHVAPNGKMYIGITHQKPEDRWANGKGYPVEFHFGKAIKKYGWENIKHEILYENLEEGQAKVMEQWLIFHYKTSNPQFGYNMTEGGDGCRANDETKRKISKSLTGQKHTEERKLKNSMSQRGKKHTEETKRKMSESHKGKKHGPMSEEHKQKLIESHKGKHLSEETKRKMSESHKGKKHGPMSEEQKQKLSIAQRGKIISEETKRKMSESHKKKNIL